MIHFCLNYTANKFYKLGEDVGYHKGYGAGYETGYEKVNPSINCGTATDPELKAQTESLSKLILKLFHPDHFNIINIFKYKNTFYQKAADLLKDIKTETNSKNFTDEINKPYTEPNISNVHYLKK